MDDILKASVRNLVVDSSPAEKREIAQVRNTHVKFITLPVPAKAFPFTYQPIAAWLVSHPSSSSGLRVTNNFLIDETSVLWSQASIHPSVAFDTTDLETISSSPGPTFYYKDFKHSNN